MRVSVRTRGLEEVVDRIDELGPLMAQNARAGIRRVLTDWEVRLKRSFRNYRGQSYPDALQNRSGLLRSSIGFELRGGRFGQGSASEVVGTGFVRGVPYARIQALGGVIRGKPFLSIPLSSSLLSSGNIRGADQVFRRGGEYVTGRGEKTFIFRSKAGNLIVAVNRGGMLHPLRVLKRSVRIPRGRFKFFEIFQERKVFRQRTFRRAVQATLRGEILR